MFEVVACSVTLLHKWYFQIKIIIYPSITGHDEVSSIRQKINNGLSRKGTSTQCELFYEFTSNAAQYLDFALLLKGRLSADLFKAPKCQT